MQLSAHSLIAAWLDIENQKYVGLEILPFNSIGSFKETVHNFAKSNALCKSKSLIIANQFHTLVPIDLYSENAHSDYLSFNQTFDRSKVNIYSASIESLKSNCIFGIHQDIERELRSAFEGLKVLPIAKPFIEATHLLKSENDECFIEINDDRFDIAIYKKNNLQLYNSFEFKAAEDLMYYLLFVWEQVGLDREKVKLSVAGQLEEEGSIFQLLYQYIRHTEWMKKPSQLKYSSILSPIANHYYFSLYNLYLCE